MKRLKYYLLQMENNTSAYTAMYEGRISVILPNDVRYTDNDHCFFYNDIGFCITHTNKQLHDKPTVTVQIPIEQLGIEETSTAAADYCLRAFAPFVDELNELFYNKNRSDIENGRFYLHRPSGEILVRNTAYFAPCPQKDYINGSGNIIYVLNDRDKQEMKMCLCITMTVQLPQKRLRRTIRMLCRDLPDTVEYFISRFDYIKLLEAVKLSETQSVIRKWLKNSEYCAFIANGSILPREKGTDNPMQNAVPFKSTPDDEIEICGIRGMGIKRGVTVITGGGYSGKSTLLDAVSAGIYDHIAGDGRELCITDDSAMTISAEDGRSIKKVNISPFIKWLPNGDTSDFSTEHASGSTSQAANIMEAVDMGVKLILIDEDRSATNFMIRDRMMKSLIEKEPITPFTDRVNELYRAKGVSTILVIGGSGEYLGVADKVYMMDDYLIHDVTEKSKRLCSEYGMTNDFPPATEWKQNKILKGEGFTSYPTGGYSEKLEVSDMGFILIGNEMIDIRNIHDIVSKRQLDALGYMLRYIEIHNSKVTLDIDAEIDSLYEHIENEGLDFVFSPFFTTTERFLDLPRKQELKAVINRMRQINYCRK